MDDFALARRALAGASDLIVIDEQRTINAAVDSGVDVLAVYDTLTRGDRAALFPGTRAPFVFAVARLPRPPKNKHIAVRGGDLLVLDGVHGPGNVGAIIRNAAAFGAAAVVALDVGRASIYRRATIRAAGPAMFRLPLQTMTVDQLSEFCERNSIAIAVTSPHAGTSVGADQRRLAIVLGSETAGCRPEIAARAELHLRVPTTDQVESLNVSAAAAVIAYERSRGSCRLTPGPT